MHRSHQCILLSTFISCKNYFSIYGLCYHLPASCFKLITLSYLLLSFVDHACMTHSIMDAWNIGILKGSRVYDRYQRHHMMHSLEWLWARGYIYVYKYFIWIFNKKFHFACPKKLFRINVITHWVTLLACFYPKVINFFFFF
jgi:hypothetical protein